jgi:ABC-type branched-subunit amino acid transport system substrate-binding protein
MLIQGLSKSPASRSELTKILEDLKDTEGATGEISMDGHRCARNLTLYGIKKGSFEVLENSVKR